MELRTASDVKRALSEATALELIHTPFPDMWWNSPSGKPPIGEARPIVKRQSSAWAVSALDKHGEPIQSWIRIDRASDVEPHGDDTFTKLVKSPLYGEGLGMTYRIHV